MNNDLNQNKPEFKSYGLKIENLSLLYGIFLIIWGIVISVLSNSESFTYFIPSFLGIPILIFAYASIKFTSKKKLFMHIVVFFGLIVFIGGLDFIRSIINGNIFENYWADLSKMMMLFTGLFFIIQCIKSFVHARKMKELN